MELRELWFSFLMPLVLFVRQGETLLDMFLEVRNFEHRLNKEPDKIKIRYRLKLKQENKGMVFTAQAHIA